MFHGKFSESPDYDESKYARIVSEATNGILHEVIPSAQEFVETLPKLIYAMDEPVAGPGLFPQYSGQQTCQRTWKVVLGGKVVMNYLVVTKIFSWLFRAGVKRCNLRNTGRRRAFGFA